MDLRRGGVGGRLGSGCSGEGCGDGVSRGGSGCDAKSDMV